MTRSNGKLSASAYVRVSSASQTSSMQRDAIARAAEARGDAIGKWYEDRFTGGGKHPAGLVELLGDARGGHVRRLYVYRLDRLSRRGIRDTFAIVTELQGAGVDLVTIADGFSVIGPGETGHELVMAILAWAAQMERQAIGERISDARRRVESKGGAWGRPRRMTPRERERARELADGGKTTRQIAVALKVPKATVWRALQKPKPKRGPKKALPRPM